MGEDWALVLPTPKLVPTSLLNPEKFVQISQSVQKLFMIFQNTDRHTNESSLYHIQVRAKKIMPHFFYLSQIRFVQDKNNF